MIQTGPTKRRRGPVPRTDLLKRLKAASAVPVIAIVAPPGYGKTTLPRQWAERDPRPFAWLSVDRYGNDPAILLADVAAFIEGSPAWWCSTMPTGSSTRMGWTRWWSWSGIPVEGRRWLSLAGLSRRCRSRGCAPRAAWSRSAPTISRWTKRPGLVDQAKLRHLATTGPRIHDQEGSLWRRGFVFRHPLGGDLMDHPSVLLAAGLPMRFRNLQGIPPDSPGLPRNLQPFIAAGPAPQRLPTPPDHTATTAPKGRVPV